jgi:hypothetical protein
MAQRIPLFCSEDKIKAFSSVNQNVSPTDLVPFLLQAQDIYLQTYIGSTFYFQLKREVLDGVVSPENQFILDEYMQPALLNWALMMALPFLKYKIYNKSVLSPTSENADSVTLEELKFLQQQLRQVAESYTTRMIQWMVLHPGDYPKYIAPVATDGQIPQYGTPYYNSLVTPKAPYAWKRKIPVGLKSSDNIGWSGWDGYDCGVNSVPYTKG